MRGYPGEAGPGRAEEGSGSGSGATESGGDRSALGEDRELLDEKEKGQIREAGRRCPPPPRPFAGQRSSAEPLAPPRAGAVLHRDFVS